LHHSTAKETAENFGTFTMAHIAQAGIAYFNLGKLREHQKLPKHSKQDNLTDSQAIEEADDEEDDDTSAVIVPPDKAETISSKLSVLVDNHEIPKVEDLQSLLLTAFTSLTQSELLVIQSILGDLWNMQTWTRALDFKEQQMLQKMHQEGKQKELDKNSTFLLTSNLDDAEDLLKGVTFTNLSNRKQPVAMGNPPQKVVSARNNKAEENVHSENEDDQQIIQLHVSVTPRNNSTSSSVQGNGKSSSSTKKSYDNISNTVGVTPKSAKISSLGLAKWNVHILSHMLCNFKITT
jgi:hypothetical protein